MGDGRLCEHTRSYCQGGNLCEEQPLGWSLPWTCNSKGDQWRCVVIHLSDMRGATRGPSTMAPNLPSPWSPRPPSNDFAAITLRLHIFKRVIIMVPSEPTGWLSGLTEAGMQSTWVLHMQSAQQTRVVHGDSVRFLPLCFLHLQQVLHFSFLSLPPSPSSSSPLYVAFMSRNYFFKQQSVNVKIGWLVPNKVYGSC